MRVLDRCRLSFVLAMLFLVAACGQEPATWQENNRRGPVGSVDSEADARDSDVSSPDTQDEEASEASEEASEPNDEATVEDEAAPPRPLQDPSRNGRFDFASYEQGLESEDYQSARIYYPIATEEDPGPFPATTTSGGFTNVKEDMDWFAERMASHGFIVIAFTPTNNLSLDPNVWARGHAASLVTLEQESQRVASPIYQAVDLERLGVSGFSMGGAGTIIAANQLADKVKVAAPFNAFQPVAAQMTAATLFLAGSADTVAISANIKNSFDSLMGAPKVYLDVAGYGHVMTMPGDHEPVISTYVLSWYHLHLNASKGYETYLIGDANLKDIDSDVFTDNGYEIELMPASLAGI